MGSHVQALAAASRYRNAGCLTLLDLQISMLLSKRAERGSCRVQKGQSLQRTLMPTTSYLTGLGSSK